MTDAAAASLAIWSADEVAERLARDWTPRALARFAEVVGRACRQAPELSRGAGLRRLARGLLGAPRDAQVALVSDPALSRWVEGLTEALDAPGAKGGVRGMLALVGRLHAGLAIATGGDFDAGVILGSAGRARLPIDGSVLQGPAGRAIRVVVRRGVLETHAKRSPTLRGFQVVDGPAEGGRMPEIRSLADAACWKARPALDAGIAVLEETAPDRLAEARALSPVLLPIAGRPDVSFSASLPSVRGCIWLSTPHPALVIAETLIHECSHLAYHLLEDATPVSEGPDLPRFSMPWRADLRPLRPALMGLHAWVRVARWLGELEGTPWAAPASQRLTVLRPALNAVRDALGDPEGLTPDGRAVVGALFDAVASV